jgi:hypothetical protein
MFPFSALKREAAGFPEILVTLYQNTRCHIPDNSNLHINVLFVTSHKLLVFIFTVGINLKVLYVQVHIKLIMLKESHIIK